MARKSTGTTACAVDGIYTVGKTESLGDVVADIIKHQIFDEHRYKPGDRLPVEQELADEMQVSRTALREGIKTLEYQGVVEIRRGVGTFVSTSFGLGEDADVESSEEEQRAILREWYHARLGTDVQAARLAAESATDEELAEIVALQARIRKMAGLDADFFKLDSEFHKAILHASHNRVLIALDASAITSWSYYLLASQCQALRQRMSSNAVNNHDLVVTCLLERDAEGAALAMRHHLMCAIRDVS